MPGSMSCQRPSGNSRVEGRDAYSRAADIGVRLDDGTNGRLGCVHSIMGFEHGRVGSTYVNQMHRDEASETPRRSQRFFYNHQGTDRRDVSSAAKPPLTRGANEILPSLALIFNITMHSHTQVASC